MFLFKKKKKISTEHTLNVIKCSQIQEKYKDYSML